MQLDNGKSVVCISMNMMKCTTFHCCIPLQIAVIIRQNEVEVHSGRFAPECLLNLTLLSKTKHAGNQVSAFSVLKYVKPRFFAAVLHSASFGTSIKSPLQ